MKVTMNKLYQIFFIQIICLLVIPLYGQNALDETIQKNVELKENIKSLQEDSIKIKNRINEMLSKIEKESQRNNELNEKYNSLMASVSKDSIMKLREYVNQLKEQHEMLQNSVTSVKQEISKKNGELKKTGSELQDMTVFSELQKQQEYKSNMLYLNQKYSQMTMEKLTEISNSENDYQTFEGFKEYKMRITAALNNKKIYDKVWKCINEGIDYQNAYKFRLELSTLLDIRKDDPKKGIYKLSVDQFNEMDSLDISLSRFNSGIRELKGIVSKINTDKEILQIRKTGNMSAKSRCKTLMKKYVIPEEGNEELGRIYKRYFKMIPYLEHLLKSYWNELKDNPFNMQTKTEKIIIDLILQ